LLHCNSELYQMLIDGFSKPKANSDTSKLQRGLFYLSLFNLLIVSLLGVLLRAYPFFDTIGLSYKNVLHGHSHFAFGGWVMPAILALLLRCFPQVVKTIAFHHLRNIALLLLISAYGMLIAFPLQGYKTISLCFSTISIVAGYYLAFVVWKASKRIQPSTSFRFLQWGLFYFVVSSFGPFATGPLIVMGKTGAPLYYDVIYFYLHFQYNGWFLFAILSMVYQYLERKGVKNNGAKVLQILNYTCLPTYFLSVLWHQPSLVFNFIGGLAALIQLQAARWLIKDISKCYFENKRIKQLLIVVFSAFLLKLILQLFSALPAIASMAHLNRNFVIAYLHLVLLGCVSLFLIIWMIYCFNIRITKLVLTGLFLFFIAFILTELIIIGLPVATMINFSLPHYNSCLLLISMLLPIGIAMVCWAIIQQQNIRSLSFAMPFFKRYSIKKPGVKPGF
jgi:hypothetical protein